MDGIWIQGKQQQQGDGDGARYEGEDGEGEAKSTAIPEEGVGDVHSQTKQDD